MTETLTSEIAKGSALRRAMLRLERGSISVAEAIHQATRPTVEESSVEDDEKRWEAMRHGGMVF